MGRSWSWQTEIWLNRELMRSWRMLTWLMWRSWWWATRLGELCCPCIRTVEAPSCSRPQICCVSMQHFDVTTELLWEQLDLHFCRFLPETTRFLPELITECRASAARSVHIHSCESCFDSLHEKRSCFCFCPAEDSKWWFSFHHALVCPRLWPQHLRVSLWFSHCFQCRYDRNTSKTVSTVCSPSSLSDLINKPHASQHELSVYHCLMDHLPLCHMAPLKTHQSHTVALTCSFITMNTHTHAHKHTHCPDALNTHKSTISGLKPERNTETLFSSNYTGSDMSKKNVSLFPLPLYFCCKELTHQEKSNAIYL